jgi:predicted membrane-bound spermidine synthase
MSSSSKPEDSLPEDESEHTYRLSKESPIAPEGIQPPPPLKQSTPKKAAKPKESAVWALVGFNALVFVTSVCVMTLELTASRLIGKHVGSSLYTWTSVIGVVLAGITLGNWLGGWLADRYDRARALSWMYLLGSVSCGSVLWLDQLVGSLPRPESFSWPAWVLTVVGVIFLMPALALGTTSPLVASMALDRSSRTGSTVGNVYAWGALGSIVGTFLTGFYLIDVWGTRSIIGLTAVTLALLAVIVAGSRRVFRTGVALGWMQLLGWTVLLATTQTHALADAGRVLGTCLSLTQSNVEATLTREKWAEFGGRVGDKLHEVGLVLGLRDDLQHQYHDESNYSDIRINDTTVDEKTVKMLRLDKLIHSYYDPGDPTSLHYEYERVYAAVTKRVAAPSSQEPLTLSVNGLEASLTQDFPDGVVFDEAAQLVKLERPSNEAFERLLAMAPEANYWKAIEQLFTETNKPFWGGFSSANLSTFPAGIVIPEEFSASLRHDETLEVLIAYKPLSKVDRDKLIAATPSAAWYQSIQKLRRESRRSSACFYGGGGFIFPRWFLQEFPGSTRIDVAELDPAVYLAVKKEMGLSPELETRIHTTVGDARNFVDDQLRAKYKDGIKTQITYDFIYADAFNDFSIPWHLTTREFLKKTHDLLSERGVFQANIIDIYPRTEFPGTSVGLADTEYNGRLPIGILQEEARRDKRVPAAKPFAPLEVMELLSNRYQFHVGRTLTVAEEKKLQNVSWASVKPPTDFEVSKGFQPPINTANEREGWQKAIGELGSRSRKKLAYRGTIPMKLGIFGGTLEGWVSAEAPFEFVEAYRIGGDQHLLGFRGIVTKDAEQSLIQLEPENKAWTDAVSNAAKRSRQSGPGRFMGRYVATAAEIFPTIYLFSTSHQQPDDNRDTFVMVCSRQPINLNSLEDTGDWTGGPFASLQTEPGQSKPVLSGQMSAVLALSEGQILTDDFAPVDNLLVPVFMSQE